MFLGAPATAPNAYTPGRPKKQKTNFRFTLGTYLFQSFQFFNFDSEKLKTNRYFYLDETSGKLTQRQREFYEENGFLVIPNLIPDELIDESRNRFLDLVNKKAEAGSILLMKDLSLKDKKGLPNERIYNKIQDFVWDEVLSKYVCLPELLDYVQCFTGSDIRAVHSMLINKPPDVGTKTSRHPLHQVCTTVCYMI